jgi:CheY-like chemotaxis protein
MSKTVVLIVEDEALIRLDVADILTIEGYEVLEAADADEAMVLLEARADIRILFTDIEMPGSMNGIALAQTVRDRWPSMLLVITSGRIAPQPSELPKNVRFVRKPSRPQQILDALKAA